MNRLLLLMLTIVLASVVTTGLLITSCSSGTSQAPIVGKSAPDFQLENLDGQFISLSSLKGKPMLINFWATWCPPCRLEMPYLQQIYDEWSAKGLVMVSVNMGESASTVINFMKSYSLSFPVLLDTRQNVAAKYNIRGIPTTFFVDKDGIIRDVIIGGFQSKAQIEARLEKIIK